MNRGRIVVVNPNSTATVTDAIRGAVEPLRLAGGPVIDCVTLSEGPPGIETQAHVESVVAPLCRLATANEQTLDALVIACFSDPGLHAVREAIRRPVFGIAECAMLSALTRGERFGILSILATSVPRHLRQVRAAGLCQRFAGDLPIGLGVSELGDPVRVLERLVAAGESLRDRHGADVLITGCAGMASQRAALEAATGVPVVEPTQAAVTMALGAVCLGSGSPRAESGGLGAARRQSMIA